MLEIASQIVLNLVIALIIGICIGFIIGKSKAKSTEQNSNNEESKKPQKDNLRKIRGVDSRLEFELNRMGITTFKQISLWTNEDCLIIGSSINAQELIEEFSWVEQAKILASGNETVYSKNIEDKE